MSMLGAADAQAKGAVLLSEDPERGTSDLGAVAPAERRAMLIKKYGLFAAPVFILALAVTLYVYYQSLDLANAVQQQSSALDWSGRLLPQSIELIQIAAYSTLLVIVLAVPLGILLTRPAARRIAPFVLVVANAGQSIPAYGLLVLAVIPFGQGTRTAVGALALYALLPVLRNTMVGLQGVDRNVIEAGRGMGLTKLQALTKIELPLAVPIIIAGIRTAMIINIGMATLVFLIGAGGLGVAINSGLKNSQDPVLIVAGGCVAVIALTFDWIGALAERYLKPRGI